MLLIFSASIDGAAIRNRNVNINRNKSFLSSQLSSFLTNYLSALQASQVRPPRPRPVPQPEIPVDPEVPEEPEVPEPDGPCETDVVPEPEVVPEEIPCGPEPEPEEVEPEVDPCEPVIPVDPCLPAPPPCIPCVPEPDPCAPEIPVDPCAEQPALPQPFPAFPPQPFPWFNQRETPVKNVNTNKNRSRGQVSSSGAVLGSLQAAQQQITKKIGASAAAQALLPQDTAEVKAAKEKFFKAFSEALAYRP